MMLVLTPQTAPIAAGTRLIAVVDYQLLAITAVMTACAAVLLLRPASAPELVPTSELVKLTSS